MKYTKLKAKEAFNEDGECWQMQGEDNRGNLWIFTAEPDNKTADFYKG